MKHGSRNKKHFFTAALQPTSPMLLLIPTAAAGIDVCKQFDVCSGIPRAFPGACFNTPTGYMCGCSWGYVWNDVVKLCVDENGCLYSPCNTVQNPCLTAAAMCRLLDMASTVSTSQATIGMQPQHHVWVSQPTVVLLSSVSLLVMQMAQVQLFYQNCQSQRVLMECRCSHRIMFL